MRPSYPIKVYFYGEGEDEETIFDDEIELATTLEWFDSEDEEEQAIAFDSLGRELIIKIEQLEVVTLKVKPQISKLL